jgi:hypothetical protein
MVLASLDAHATNDLVLVSAGLVLQEDVVFEERKVWMCNKIGFVQMDEDGNLENSVRVHVN